MPKVVIKSNYGKEMYFEKEMCRCVTMQQAEDIAKALNAFYPKDNEDFYKAESDDYVLYKFQP